MSVIPFVVAAPSGAGKTSVCRAVVERDTRIGFSVSHTTRARRRGELEGTDYYFVTDHEFREMTEAGEFVESAEYGGHLYGTSWRALREPMAEGRDVLLDIEIQGAEQVRRRLEDARLLFLVPPSMEELERRLVERGTDDLQAIERRLAIARREFEAMPLFDYLVENDVLERAVEDVLAIIRAERADDTAQVRATLSREARQGHFERALGLG